MESGRDIWGYLLGREGLDGFSFFFGPVEEGKEQGGSPHRNATNMRRCCICKNYQREMDLGGVACAGRSMGGRKEVK